MLKVPAQKAVDFTASAQNEDGGWGYGPKDDRSDVEHTAWAIMLLKSAELSGLPFDGDIYLRTIAWIDNRPYGRSLLSLRIGLRR